MKFRYARHTKDLKALEKFYTEILELEVLGGFQNHDEYDGLFLGLKNENWHLEFTTSPEIPNQIIDEDDLMVFYPKNQEELNKITANISKNNIKIHQPKNPYWQENGILIKDPDQYGVIISKNF